MRLKWERYKTFVIGTVILIMVGAGMTIRHMKEGQIVSDVSTPLIQSVEEADRTKEDTTFYEPTTPIFADLKGAVVHPGLYRAEDGDRVQDIVMKAGGFQEDAAVDKVNLAQKVIDEMVIYIPKIGEESGFDWKTNIGSSSQSEQGKINLNTADASRLETLPGIGPAKAQAILEYRDQVGAFKTIEDMKDISGIGEKTFEKLKEHITVQ